MAPYRACLFSVAQNRCLLSSGSLVLVFIDGRQVAMKLVIKVDGSIISDSHCTGKFAKAIACLLHDDHRVTVIHGGHETFMVLLARLKYLRDELERCTFPPSAEVLRAASIPAIGAENQALVASLAQAGVSSFGFSGSDGGICQLRKKHLSKEQGCFTVETGRVDARWIDIICNNGGVPVLSNLALAPWREHYLIDSDQMAAVCAADWGADALIYFTEGEGIQDLNGSVIRWLEVGDIGLLEKNAALTADMCRKLIACSAALKHGVGRVRILPASNVDILAMFFCSRIESGTEVIAVAS